MNTETGPAAKVGADNFGSAWRELGKRRAVAWLAILLCLPLSALAGFGSLLLFGANAGTEVVGFALFVFIVFAWQRRIDWPCPQCGRPFFAKWYFWPFAKRCQHCALPLYALDSAESRN